MRKWIIKTLLLVAVFLAATSIETRAAESTSISVSEKFTDVHKEEWYLEYIQYVFDNNLMKGHEGTFKPLKNITKAEVAQSLYNMSGVENYNHWDACLELKDVVWDVWYTDAVCWAYDNGIITGDLNSKKFYPNSDVTREQLALMFYRYAKYKKLDTAQFADLTGLVNAENVSNWSEKAVKWAVEVGLMSGIELYKDGKVTAHDLAPQGSATRAQMAAIMMRFLEEPKVQQPAKPGTEDEDESFKEPEGGRWLYEINADNTITIIDYEGEGLERDLILPLELGGRKVTVIGEEALAHRGINSITIPKGIKTIGNRAFAECRNLKTIIIEEGVEEVAKDSFEGCWNLLYGGIEKIVFRTDASGVSAWIKSGALQDLKAKFLYPVADTSWTKEIQESVGAKGTWETYETETDAVGTEWIFQKKEDQTVVLLGYLGCPATKEIEIPEHLSGLPVSEIPDRAFQCMAIESIIIPETVTKIGEAAFNGCRQLKHVAILGNVGEIASRLFDDCWNLESVELPDGITAIGDNAFGFCERLKSIEIPDSVLRIGESAFRDCLKMEYIQLPKNLQEMGEDAFRINPSLKELVLPSTITEIPKNAFFGCSSLKYVVIPNGVESIGESAFENCYRMSKLEISETVKIIMESAFYGCDSLDFVKFYGDTPTIMENTFYDVTATVYYSGEKEGWTEEVCQNYGGDLRWTSYAESKTDDGQTWTYSVNDDQSITLTGYVGEESLTKLEVPVKIDGKPVTAIAASAFTSMDSLREVEIPEEISEVGKRAFYGCSNLEKATINSQLTQLSEDLFMGCSSLKEFRIPESVVVLERGVFEGCTGLESVFIPESVQTIGEFAFYQCTGLKNVEVPEGVIMIDNYAFAHCDALEKMILPQSVTTLGNEAFWNCDRLHTVELPVELQTMGNGVFSGCEMLQQVELPSNLTILPEETFRNCKALKQFTIPETVETIGARALQFCENLETITIPASVKNVDDGVFYGCTSLSEVFFEGEMPGAGNRVFAEVEATIYYPEGDSTWEEPRRELFEYESKKLTWISKKYN